MNASGSRVVVARTGVANLASVCAALRRAGLGVECTEDPSVFEEAAMAVLPGVGSFASGMLALRSTGLDQAVKTRVARSRPLLAICLGMQMLCEASEESPGVEGLAIIPARVSALTAEPRTRVPQLGWNRVDAGTCTLARDGLAYFANSYAATTIPDGWDGAWFDHGGRRVATFERGPLLACQFHPELSGDWGRALIGRWVRASLREGGRPC